MHYFYAICILQFRIKCGKLCSIIIKDISLSPDRDYYEAFLFLCCRPLKVQGFKCFFCA